MIRERLSRSQNIFKRSQSIFPGGVNSPVRSFYSVGGDPIVLDRGKGKILTDVNGKSYIDFCCSWGPLILGHGHPRILKAIEKQLHKATTFGTATEIELLLGSKIKEWVRGLEMMRFVSSGTEATMSAIRVARAATKRNKIIKFRGCYHGHADPFLVEAGSGLATLSLPSSAGVPDAAVKDTLIVDFNDQEGVKNLFSQYPDDIASIIIEPIPSNMGLVLPKEGFLEFLREICNLNNSILIFDEVITGFRLGRGGASEYMDVEPDLWTFGKIIGGGLPAAAYGGKESLMKLVAPLGPVYQAGTLSGNPLAMAAGLETLHVIEEENIFEKLEKLGNELDRIVEEKLSESLQAQKLEYVRVGSIFSFFYGVTHLPAKFQDVKNSNLELFNRVFHELLKDGIYLGPSGYEVGFLSACHDVSDLEKFVGVIQRCI